MCAISYIRIPQHPCVPRSTKNHERATMRAKHIHAERMENLLDALEFTSKFAAAVQLATLCLVIFFGEPGLVNASTGRLMYISDNLHTKPGLGTLFFMSFIPSWMVLACSVSFLAAWTQALLIFFMSMSVSAGFAITFYTMYNHSTLHYIAVGFFVASIALTHLLTTLTANHFKFMQRYVWVLVLTACCGVAFIAITLSIRTAFWHDLGAILEYTAMLGFIWINSMSTDRVREHLEMHVVVS